MVSILPLRNRFQLAEAKMNDNLFVFGQFHTLNQADKQISAASAVRLLTKPHPSSDEARRTADAAGGTDCPDPTQGIFHDIPSALPAAADLPVCARRLFGFYRHNIRSGIDAGRGIAWPQNTRNGGHPHTGISLLWS